MNSIDELFAEIEKHAVLRGHARLIKESRDEIAAKDAEIKRLKDKVNRLVDKIDRLERMAALNDLNASNFYR